MFEYKRETTHKNVKVKKASTKSFKRASITSAQAALSNSVTCQKFEKTFSYAIIPISVLHHRDPALHTEVFPYGLLKGFSSLFILDCSA